MAGSKRAATEEETVAPRINSGNLSDQFHRELSSNGDDLLQAELTIDDINSASGAPFACQITKQLCDWSLQPTLVLHRERSVTVFEPQYNTVEFTCKT